MRTSITCVLLLLVTANCLIVVADEGTDKVSRGMPLVFSEDFERDSHKWKTTDDKAWFLHPAALKTADGIAESSDNQVFGLKVRISDYQPKVRSPHNIALINDVQLADFVLTFRVRSTKDTGNHRDCCIFFCYQDSEHFYYAHLGAKPDPHSGQIMIVNGEPRKAITENTKTVPWDDLWHTVKVARDNERGTIEVYFDDMTTPHMKAVEKTFGRGQIGIGSFDDMNDFDDIKLYGR